MMQSITIQPCLLCDSATEVDYAEWCSREAPIALCEDCCPLVEAGIIPWPLVSMIYVMRVQISKLQETMDITKNQIGQLFAAQQELEQGFLQKNRR